MNHDPIHAPRPSLRGWLISLGIAALVSTGPVAARPDDSEQPILIEADEVEVLESERTSIYVGQVQVDQGSMQLRGDHVTVHHREDRRPRLIIALGAPASFRQLMDDNEGEVLAFARRMEYDADKDELTLIDEALLIQGADRLTGERIVYDRARAHFRAGGGGRVQITITPDEATEP
ncbi:lipopolysaccharide transport periplasmic protein LptA [Thiocapsa imhoffii]|uniref:Lipopolysaccharide export system protein LptA n=1 Tax=Thiocapsa imhoffii TaxID=382777 RepID=A0A9X0WF14_9GAMM|nr:lipopolysaccharide transport periplasmic protein LptA [Thiocapsa imhoffii]MBK1643499.1 lipopolysaccharide transport periplasmic protein LptA [Thiocapsa imhoffii]